MRLWTLLLMLGFTCVGGAAAAQTIVPIDVHTAFLHLDTVDNAGPALAIDLGAMGLQPGDTIDLESTGDWNAGPGGDVQTGLLVVFSENNTLLSRTLLHRVPGALGAGLSNDSGPTWPNNEPTDIAGDFGVGRPGVRVRIPAGATHLFVTAADISYLDNSDPDGDLGTRLTRVSTTSVPLGGTGEVLSAQPNPFHAETSVHFGLERATPMRITIHDVSGRLVRDLCSGVLPAGRQQVRWDGRESSGRRAPPGTYFARLDDGASGGWVRIGLLR